MPRFGHSMARRNVHSCREQTLRRWMIRQPLVQRYDPLKAGSGNSSSVWVI